MTLGELSREVFLVLAEFTVFPWPVLKAQAARAGIDPSDLSVAQLHELVERLASGVERFTSPQAGSEVRHRLQGLLRERKP